VRIVDVLEKRCEGIKKIFIAVLRSSLLPIVADMARPEIKLAAFTECNKLAKGFALFSPVRSSLPNSDRSIVIAAFEPGAMTLQKGSVQGCSILLLSMHHLRSLLMNGLFKGEEKRGFRRATYPTVST